MKKLTILSIMLLAGVLTACHNQDWEFPDYKYTTVYFAYQTPVRTIVLGEDIYDTSLDNAHKCKIMATTGGVYQNNHNIVLDLSLDENLCKGFTFGEGGETVEAMPHHYYNYDDFVNTKLTIPSGQIAGGIEVQLTDEFFKDEKAIQNKYVIPMVINSVSNADSILRGKPAVANPNRLIAADWGTQPKDYILYCIKYINPWDATYLRRGKEVVTEDGAQREIVRHASYVEKDEKCALNTYNLKTVTASFKTYDKNKLEVPFTMSLTFDDNNNCIVKQKEGADYVITGNGRFVKDGDKKSWGQEDRDAIYLDYTLTLGNSNTYAIKDTLVVLTRGVVAETFKPVAIP